MEHTCLFVSQEINIYNFWNDKQQQYRSVLYIYIYLLNVIFNPRFLKIKVTNDENPDSFLRNCFFRDYDTNVSRFLGFLKIPILYKIKSRRGEFYKRSISFQVRRTNKVTFHSNIPHIYTHIEFL